MQAILTLVGDFDSRVIAHQAIPLAIERATRSLQVDWLGYEWKHTASLGSLEGYDGVWCVPASPYADEGAALEAIRWAREGRVPFLEPVADFNMRCSNSRGMYLESNRPSIKRPQPAQGR